MNEYINRRLINWADWSRRKEDGGLGYPSSCNFTRLGGGNTAGAGAIVLDADAHEVECVMQKIRMAKPKLAEVAYWVYLAGNLSMAAVAGRLGCGRNTAYERLDALQREVGQGLDDLKAAQAVLHGGARVSAMSPEKTIQVPIAAAKNEKRWEGHHRTRRRNGRVVVVAE